MQVLITGAAGRIGTVLAAGLAGRYRLRLTDRVDPASVPPNAVFEPGDIGDDAAVASLCRDVDAVIHLAGHPSSSDWEEVGRLNIDGSRRVFEAAARAGARRIVFASSIHVAGFLPADTPFTDDVAPLPDGPYGVSKAAGEMLLRYVCARFGISGVALRICSFEPAPECARHLRTWISPGDMVRLAAAALDAPLDGFNATWGLSNNARAPIERGMWARLGYEPLDDAEAYVAALLGAGVDTGVVSEWPFLGGSFAVPPP